MEHDARSSWRIHTSNDPLTKWQQARTTEGPYDQGDLGQFLIWVANGGGAYRDQKEITDMEVPRVTGTLRSILEGD
jgi:hypothetical protein